MRLIHTHASDAELLLAAEGESQRWQRHVDACDACRARQLVLLGVERTLAQPAQEVQDDAARARLLTALGAETSSRWAWLTPRVYAQVAVVAMLLVAAATWRQAYSPLQKSMAAYEETGPEPNPVLTPGAVRSVELAELCSLDDAELDPRVSPEKERAVFAAYGMDEKAAHAYQVDYLINPQLGGNDERENLWPEPYHATVWNATAKDALETRLHGMVCSGQLSLADAQHDLATDWIGAYKKYFHASRPVRTVASIETPKLQ